MISKIKSKLSKIELRELPSSSKQRFENYVDEHSDDVKNFRGYLDIDYKNGWIQKTNKIDDDEVTFIAKYPKIVEYDSNQYTFDIRATKHDGNYIVAFDILNLYADMDDENEVQTFASEIIRDEAEFEEKSELEKWINNKISEYDTEKMKKRLRTEDDNGQI